MSLDRLIQGEAAQRAGLKGYSPLRKNYYELRRHKQAAFRLTPDLGKADSPPMKGGSLLLIGEVLCTLKL